MRVAIVVVFCFIALAQCNYITSRDVDSPYFPITLGSNGPLPTFFSIIDDKVIESCPKLKVDLQVARQETMSCGGSANISVESKANLCSNEFQKNVERCTRPIINFYAVCLPEKFTYLPEMILKGFLSLTKFICENNGNPGFEAGFQDLCIPSPHNDLYKKFSCLENVTRKAEHLAFNMPTKYESCRFVDELKTCIQESFIDKCHTRAAKKTYSQYLNAAFFECGRSHTHISDF